jgi:hypothetical protein
LALILITFLVLLGCPSSTGSSVIDQEQDGDVNPPSGGSGNPVVPGPTQAEKDARALTDTLNKAAKTTVAEVEGATVTLTQSIMIKPALAASMKAAVEATIGSLAIPGGVTFKVNPNVVVTVAANAKIEVAASGTVTLVAKGDDDAGGKIVVESRGTLTTSGTVKVETGGTVTVQGGTVSVAAGTVEVAGNFDVEAGNVTVTGTLAVTSGTVTVTDAVEVVVNGNVTVAADGAVTGNGSLTGSGTVSGDGIVTVDTGEVDTDALKSVLVDSVNDLKDAIEDIRENNKQGTVIHLTETFYSAADAVIVVDADDTRNTTPYTIKGLGKDSSAPALSVGILLANDNVTLDGVKIAVTEPTKAAITKGLLASFTNTRYTAAITIGRTDNGSGWLTGDQLANNNVTVKDSTISYTYSTLASGYNFSVGIYVNGDPTAATPKNISITGNTVSAAGYSTNAAQGVYIGHYDPSMVITDNILTSQTGGAQTINAPASALFLNIAPAKIGVGSTATPQISDNTLNGCNIDFYVNLLGTGDYVGIPALFDDKFGTNASNWVTNATTDTSSFYKNLYTNLIGQARTTGYAGLFFMVFGSDNTGKWNGDQFAYEAWEKTDGKVTAIDYWGPTIEEEADTYALSGSQSSDVSAGNGGYGYRGRILLDATGAVTDRDGDFHWNTSDTDTTYPTKPTA